MKNLGQKLKQVGVVAGLVGCGMGLGGCETPQQTRAFGTLLQLGAIGPNSDLTYDQRMGLSVIGSSLENEAQNQYQVEAAREGRSNINVNVNVPEQNNQSRERQTGLTSYEDLNFNEYPGNNLKVDSINFYKDTHKITAVINGIERTKGEKVDNVNLYYIGAGWVILKHNNDFYKLKKQD